MSEAQSGASLRLAPGQKLTVSLPVQMGTGFSWQLIQGEKLLRLDEKAVEAAASSPGGRESQVFKFTVVRQGKGPLVLVYRRPWEREAPATKEFKLFLDVDQ